jgi:hypothetical protein
MLWHEPKKCPEQSTGNQPSRQKHGKIDAENEEFHRAKFR